MWSDPLQITWSVRLESFLHTITRCLFSMYVYDCVCLFLKNTTHMYVCMYEASSESEKSNWLSGLLYFSFLFYYYYYFHFWLILLNISGALKRNRRKSSPVHLSNIIVTNMYKIKIFYSWLPFFFQFLSLSSYGM